MNEEPAEIEVIGWDENLDAGRLTVRTSDGATYEVAPSAPELSGLALGSRLDAGHLAGLRAAATRKAVAKEALRLLDRRFYSRRRLRLRLLQSGFDEEAVEAVLHQLVQQDLLDDDRFARAWTHDQLRRKPVGRRWLRSGLRDQGIPDGVIEKALDEVLSPQEEEEACRRALASRRYSLDEEKARARAHRFLVSRGFPESLARETVFRAHEENRGGTP